MSWAMNDDGTASDEFKDWGEITSSGLSAPANVAATDSLTDKVTITWNSVEGATYYRVFRGITTDTDDMTLLQDNIAVLTFDDTTANDTTVYYYAVKAFNATQTSGFSSVTDGKLASVSGPDDVDVSDAVVSTTVTVPAGANRMEVELWGGGGAGGGGVKPSPWGGYTVYPGGGGASGSYYHMTGIEVTAGEQFELQVGGSGERSQIVRDDNTSAYATPGGNGADATYTAIGTPGQPASSEGANDLATGSVEPDISVGNAGVDDTGGTSLDGTYGRGEGGDGSTTNGVRPAGVGGRIRVKFTTV